jgi:hypothetical protein
MRVIVPMSSAARIGHNGNFPSEETRGMRSIVVRYETKPEHADENERLVEAVFAELRAKAPTHFGYATFRLDDGVSFVHVMQEYEPGDLALNDLPAFQAFTAGVGERCAVPPDAKGAKVVGAYNLAVRPG